MKQRLSSLLLALTALLVFSLPASAAVLRNGVYLIQMANTNLTVAATSEKKGARLVLWQYRPTATWKFTHLGNDVYQISTNKSVMDSSGNERRNGVPIIIWPHNGGKNQQWKVIRRGKHYNLINVGTGLALDLPNNQRAPRVQLQGYQRNNSGAQQFDIIPR